jgi:fused signal recognition particle receptor
MSFLGKLFSKENQPDRPASRSLAEGRQAGKQSLDQGLEKSKENFFSKLGKAIAGKSSVDEEVLDQLEEILISSDVGVDTTLKIIQRIQTRVARDKYVGTTELDSILKQEIAHLLSENNTEDLADFETPTGKKPYVLLVVGVNGVGKTTTIGKLAAQFKKRGKSVVLGAADTFRAAAVDQLKLWGERVGVPVISKGMNTDPSAVAFEAVEKGMELGADVIIIDTAGRLHTKINLMQELSKIKRVIQKVIPDAPHDVMLVLDGSTGQNAVVQAREFTKATDVTCLAITKLDGTAKGGVVIGISDEFKIPVKYIGVGEKIDDLQAFNKKEFVDSLFKRSVS